jgi:putative FmdB family regulatory protein
MPVYEYLCSACRKRKSVLVRTVGEEPSPVCDSCGNTDLSRLISRVAYHRSMQDVWDQSGSPESAGPDYYKDPRNIGRWAEDKFKAIGQEMPGQVKEMIDAARDGTLPDSVSSLDSGLGEV